MGNMAESGKGSEWVVKAACGRDLATQIADIRATGSHGAIPVLRAMALAANGFVAPAETADLAVLFGCYRPFSTPFVLRDVARLLRRFDVSFTWLAKENCCGLPLLHQVAVGERQAMRGLIREFVTDNRELARGKGASRLAYCCAGCAHTAKSVVPGHQAEHAYILDVLLDALAGQRFRIAPFVVAYFEGCHTSSRKVFPETSLDWGRYRQFCDTIDGLRVIDLPNTMCCKVQPDRIIDKAVALGVDAVVCPCSGCTPALRLAGEGKLPVLHYTELLVRCLEEETGCPI